MSIQVRIPAPLRTLTDGADTVEIPASDAPNVGALINALEVKHPGLKERICDENGEIRKFVNVYLNEEDIRFEKGMETELKAGQELSILPAVAGGQAKKKKAVKKKPPVKKKAKKKGDAAVFPTVRRLYLTFAGEVVTQPIVYELIKKFAVIPNIRGASVTEQMGIMSMELSGNNREVERACAYLKKRGVKVDPIEMNVVEP